MSPVNNNKNDSSMVKRFFADISHDDMKCDTVENVDSVDTLNQIDPAPDLGTILSKSQLEEPCITVSLSGSAPDSITQIPYMGRSVPVRIWSKQCGKIGKTISFDTETDCPDSPAVIPTFVLGIASNGREVYFVFQEDLEAFWRLHQGCKMVHFHTFWFDCQVMEKACPFRFEQMVEEDRIRDLSITYRLAKIAMTGNLPPRYSLDHISEKELEVTLDKSSGTRTSYGALLGVPGGAAKNLTSNQVEYAALDGLTTFEAGERFEQRVRALAKSYYSNPDKLMSHGLQLRSSLVLGEVYRRGVAVDHTAAFKAEQHWVAERDKALNELRKHAYIPGQPGVKKRFKELIIELEKLHGVTIPETPKSGNKSEAEEDLKPLAHTPFVGAFLGYRNGNKMLKTFIRHLKDSTRIFPRYSELTATGRTSCSSPNLQQMPRHGGIRECIVPAPGHKFIQADYSAAELVTLGQLMMTKYGSSNMADLINAGVDLHEHVAGKILGKPAAAVTKTERQAGKALNFGLPGGLGASSLVDYARINYSVFLTLEQATEFRDAWFAEFPEVSRFMREEGTHCVIHPFGRVRGGCKFTTFHNTPFQGMSADGAKLALWNLRQNGYRIAGFVHDEVLIEVVDDGSVQVCRDDIERIMIESMKTVCPDVKVGVESQVTDHWTK